MVGTELSSGSLIIKSLQKQYDDLKSYAHRLTEIVAYCGVAFISALGGQLAAAG